MASYIKHEVCRNKNPTAIGGEHNIKWSYPSMNACIVLKNLYAKIIPSVFSSQHTRRDFSQNFSLQVLSLNQVVVSLRRLVKANKDCPGFFLIRQIY